MNILAEILVWSVVVIAISVALGVTLPSFFRTLNEVGADVFPDFLRGSPKEKPGKKHDE